MNKMAILNNYLNVNGLNAPIKRHCGFKNMSGIV